jgi:hypothetical protein
MPAQEQPRSDRPTAAEGPLRDGGASELLRVPRAPGAPLVHLGSQVATAYDRAEVGQEVINDPAYLRFIQAVGICMRYEPGGTGRRCTRHRGHDPRFHVVEGTRHVQALWSEQEQALTNWV